jgi:hypothetical protein
MQISSSAPVLIWCKSFPSPLHLQHWDISYVCAILGSLHHLLFSARYLFMLTWCMMCQSVLHATQCWHVAATHACMLPSIAILTAAGQAFAAGMSCGMAAPMRDSCRLACCSCSCFKPRRPCIHCPAGIQQEELVNHMNCRSFNKSCWQQA